MIPGSIAAIPIHSPFKPTASKSERKKLGVSRFDCDDPLHQTSLLKQCSAALREHYLAKSLVFQSFLPLIQGLSLALQQHKHIVFWFKPLEELQSSSKTGPGLKDASGTGLLAKLNCYNGLR